MHGGRETGGEEFPYADVPRPGKKWERTPSVTPMKVFIRRAKEERRARRENPCRVLEHPPGNGLLVPHLGEVAHRVHSARERLLDCLTRLVEGDAAIPVKWYYGEPPLLKCVASALAQASQVQKVGAEKGVVPAGYIGVPANVQQFVGNQAAMCPSIVYMVPVCHTTDDYILLNPILRKYQ